MPIRSVSGYPLSRREILKRSCQRIRSSGARESARRGRFRSTDERNGTPFPARAKQVIFLYMDGGPSQVDTFDPKPRLDRGAWPAVQDEDGADAVQQQRQHARMPLEVQPVRPKRHCRSASCFRTSPGCVDELAVVRSMTSKFSEHTTANYFLHTGLGPAGPAQHGRLVRLWPGQRVPGSARLRRAQRRLDSAGRGRLISAPAFCRPRYQGSMFQPQTTRRWPTFAAAKRPPRLQRNKLALLRKLDAAGARAHRARTISVESAIANYELAYRMQSAVPELIDFGDETPATQAALRRSMPSSSRPRSFARQCLLARRLVERGVRFIELTCPEASATAGTSTPAQGRAREQRPGRRSADRRPAGRSEAARAARRDAGRLGRRVRPHAVRPGQRRPRPQSLRLHASGWPAAASRAARSTARPTNTATRSWRTKLEIHDLHATMLHLLGIDHKRLTFRFGGRDMRLTDVHGEVVHDLIA